MSTRIGSDSTGPADLPVNRDSGGEASSVSPTRQPSVPGLPPPRGKLLVLA